MISTMAAREPLSRRITRPTSTRRHFVDPISIEAIFVEVLMIWRVSQPEPGGVVRTVKSRSARIQERKLFRRLQIARGRVGKSGRVGRTFAAV
jgi:hypothetical protein